MDTTELREKSIDELRALSTEYRRRLFDLRFKHYTGQLTNTAEVRATRRSIARIETVIRERDIAQRSAD